MYFINLVVSLFFILNISNFIKHHTKIETKKIFFLTILAQITFGYIFFFILKINHIFFLFLLLNFFFLIQNLKYKFLLEVNSLVYFLFTYFIFATLTLDRYYLDYDEFTYWGKVLKYFSMSLSNEPFFLNKNANWTGDFANITHAVHNINPFYHPVGVPIYISLNSYISGYNEYSSIFYNNLIILTGFFYLFFQPKNWADNLIKFLIFFLLINNLSFGLISIYVDAIISIIFSCILLEVFKDNKNNKHLIIVFLTLSILAIHRSGIIYALFSLLLILLNNKKIFIKGYLIIFLFIFMGIITNFSILANLNYNNFIFNPSDFFLYIINSFSVPIYFSSFGAMLNTLFQIINYNFEIPLYQITISFWFVTIIFLILFNKSKKILLLTFLFFTFFLLTVLFFEKINLPNMSLLVIGRYMALLFLSYLLFLTSNYNYNLKVYSLIIILLVAITPSKTFGLFVTNKIYLMSDKNQKFYSNRIKIKKKFKDQLNKENKIIIFTNDQLNQIISKEDKNFYLEIIEYEIYPANIEYIEDVNDDKLEKYKNLDNVIIRSLNLPKTLIEKTKKTFLKHNLDYQNITLY